MQTLKPLLCTVLASIMAMPAPILAASHREAPITALDRTADITDFFAFVSYDDPTKVTMILDVDPFLEPGNGPNYFPFDDNILYQIHVDNNNTATDGVVFNIQFTTQILAPQVFTGFVGAGTGIAAQDRFHAHTSRMNLVMARKARPRWLIASLSCGDSSAVVVSMPSGTKIGS